METNPSALPERILYLCTCAAWAAKGDLEHLETAVPQALDHGVTINELKAEYDCIGKPFNLPSKYWIGVDANAAEEDLLKDLTRNSYEIVKAKYSKKK